MFYYSTCEYSDGEYNSRGVVTRVPHLHKKHNKTFIAYTRTCFLGRLYLFETWIDSDDMLTAILHIPSYLVENFICNNKSRFYLVRFRLLFEIEYINIWCSLFFSQNYNINNSFFRVHVHLIQYMRCSTFIIIFHMWIIILFEIGSKF